MSNETKLCKDCRFYSKDHFLGIGFCVSPKCSEVVTTNSVVEGIQHETVEIACVAARSPGGKCGKDAIHFSLKYMLRLLNKFRKTNQ